MESTNEFIKHILTTPPSSSHISDFRQQKRTDSRADKPDMFPGFDFQVDSPTPSPRKRRRQAYSKLIRLFIQNTRDRLDTIRDVIKDESELHFRLNRPQGETVEIIDDSMPESGSIRFLDETNDEQNRKFIDFAFADATSSDSENDTGGASSDVAAQTYLNSLFAAIGYSRVATTPKPESSQDNIFARYVINPLLNVWNSTRDRLFLNNENIGNEAVVRDDIMSDDQTTIFRVNFFDNRNDSNIKMQTKLENITNVEANKANNSSLPHIENTSNNVTNIPITNGTIVGNGKVNVSQTTLDAVDINDDHVGGDKKPRNTAPGNVDDAAAAFRSAFLRYSKNTQNPAERLPDIGENYRLPKNHSNDPKNSNFIDGTLFSGNLFDENSSHIQVVPGKKNEINESINDITTIANDIDEATEVCAKSFGENAGILILEIFGTVIGMTWRAVSEIPNYFNSNQNQHV